MAGLISSVERVRLLGYRVNTTGRWLILVFAVRLTALDTRTRLTRCQVTEHIFSQTID
jgi:hypothetical protein